MSKVIWKYPVNMGGAVLMPDKATILSCQLQNGMPVLWAEVDPAEPTVNSRVFKVVPTGGDVPDRGSYLSTFQVDGLVFHVYEVLRT